MTQKPKRTLASMVSDYGKRLFAFVRGRVDNEADAEDIVQDVWYQLSALTNIDDLESASGWLYQVARNRITDLYRRRKPDRLDDYAIESDEGEWLFKEILLLDDSGDPELAMFKELFWQELMKALDELPANQREVFVLNELEDLTLQQIADKTGENLKTIISRKRYAVQHLRKKLEPLYRELEGL